MHAIGQSWRSMSRSGSGGLTSQLEEVQAVVGRPTVAVTNGGVTSSGRESSRIRDGEICGRTETFSGRNFAGGERVANLRTPCRWFIAAGGFVEVAGDMGSW